MRPSITMIPAAAGRDANLATVVVAGAEEVGYRVSRPVHPAPRAVFRPAETRFAILAHRSRHQWQGCYGILQCRPDRPEYPCRAGAVMGIAGASSDGLRHAGCQ